MYNSGSTIVKIKEYLKWLKDRIITHRTCEDYQPAIHEDIYLRVNVADGECNFAYSLNGKKYTAVEGNFKIKEGKWIGAKVGLAAIEPAGKTNRGWIDADWFRVTP